MKKTSKFQVFTALLAGLALTGISCQAAQTPSPAAASESLADVVARVEPGTVLIKVTVPAKADSGGAEEDFFQDLLGHHRPKGPQHALGSGFVVDSRGYIVTNYHVASPEDSQIEVVLEDGTPYAATFVGGDKDLDITVLKINPHGKALTPLAWGDSDALRKGESVIAIGNPRGLEFSVTQGIVSALHRNPQMDDDDNDDSPSMNPYADFIQTDAAINPGNSGGPLMTRTGQVIGINDFIETENGGSEGLGFAIPSAEARKAVADIIGSGKIRYSRLGVETNQVLLKGDTPDIEPNPGRGALVSMVRIGSAAEKAGVKAGDVITKFDGKPVLSQDNLRVDIAFSESGTHHTLTIQRDGKEITLNATPEPAPPETRKPSAPVRAFGR